VFRTFPIVRVFLGLCLLLLNSCKKDLIHPAQIIQLDSHTQNRLNNFLFVNDSLGFCVGGSRFYEADILTTHDGGLTWSLYVSPDAHKELFSIIQSPSGDLFITGFEGNYLRSSDQGQTWLHSQLRYEVYKALAFQDAAHLQFVGGISFNRGDAMFTDTAGNITAHDSLGYELNDIHIRTDGIGYRCGYGIMQYTNNFGLDWQWTTMRNDNYTAVWMIDAQTAFTCGGEGSICVTHNSGKDWTTLRNGNDLTHPKFRLQNLAFLNASKGYAVGENGVIIYTDDGGAHWSELDHFIDDNLHGIIALRDGSLLVCGENGALWKIRP